MGAKPTHFGWGKGRGGGSGGWVVVGGAMSLDYGGGTVWTGTIRPRAGRPATVEPTLASAGVSHAVWRWHGEEGGRMREKVFIFIYFTLKLKS